MESKKKNKVKCSSLSTFETIYFDNHENEGQMSPISLIKIPIDCFTLFNIVKYNHIILH
jgi:hypothetical protein